VELLVGAVNLLNDSTFGKWRWAGLTYIGWQGIREGWWEPCLRLGLDLSAVGA
jgi:hypothetical protein